MENYEFKEALNVNLFDTVFVTESVIR